MNTYFCDIGPFLSDNLSNSDNCFEAYINTTNTTFEIPKISDLDVKSEILKIKTSKATGPDRISPKLLKDSVEVIAESLTKIFNKSIEFGIFPDDFKTVCISPIHKGDRKLECSNYRPISIITVVANVFEKLISRQFIGYLETNHLLSDSQSGFRKKSSTTTFIVNNMNQWYINMDKGLLNGIIFLDLKKPSTV